jgi:uncharacterized protein YxjI
MRYKLRQKVFSFTDAFKIEDEIGNAAYTIKGKFFSFGDKLTMLDAYGEEVARIEQKLLSFAPTYYIYCGNDLLATVSKKLFTLFRCKFTVDVPGPDDLEASGNFFDMEYTFERGNGNVVAVVSKQWFSFSDTYGVDIADNEDPVLILASAVVIDMVCHSDQND